VADRSTFDANSKSGDTIRVPADRPVSSLVLAELYDSGDARFLDLILQHGGNARPLLGLIEKWKKDSRPWAHRLKMEFLLGGKSPWESRVVFKRLFKQAWADRDHELMGAFMVALDCSIRRKRQKRYRYQRGAIETTEVLRLPAGPSGNGFSTATRHYLRRRAWRYFRLLGRSRAAEYVPAVAGALIRYTDDDVRAGENLLDNWGLMHACFGKSPVLTFSSRHTNLASSGRLGDLLAAPMFERHWAASNVLSELLDITLRAQCRAVRVWSIQLVRRLHAESLPKIDAQTLLRLIDHTDVDVAAFAAELLNNASTVSSFPMATWMDLLATRNPAVIATICQAFQRHVSFDRVTLEQAIELTSRSAVPVARLGLEILGSKTIRSDPDQRALAKLSDAMCSALGNQIAQFALSRLNVPRIYLVDEVVGFFDSGLKSLRQGAFAALVEHSPAHTDPAFWVKLFESPYDDVRIELVNCLKKRMNLPGASADAIASLWQTVLLNIHRGGRAKLSALRQISIVREPQSAKTLLPVLIIAIRSVRPPEARHGLAAVVSAIDRAPSLAEDVKRQLPELQLDLMGEAR
jgi:hypothetical protein